MSLEELLLTPVTVASKATESFREAPSSVTVFTRQEIQNLGIATIEELLNFVPGMQSTRIASRSSYSVTARGRNAAGLSNDILFLLNGQRLNDNFSGSTVLFNRFLATGNVKQVEIVRGPGSALYGSNAFLGVVNIVTSVDLNEGYVAAGSHDSVATYVAASGGNDHYHTSLFVNGAKDHGDRFLDPSSPTAARIADPQEVFSAYATFESQDIRIDARHARFSVDDFYVFGVVPGNDVNEYRAADSSLGIEWRIVTHEDRELRARAGARRIENKGLTEIIDSTTMQALNTLGVTGGTETFLGGSVVTLTEWSMQLDGMTRIGDRHRLYSGVEYRTTKFDKIRNQNNYEATDLPAVIAAVDLQNLTVNGPLPSLTYYGNVVETAPFGPDGESRDIFGAYLQDKIAISENLDATLGLRLDHYSDFGSTVNPRAAIVYQTSPVTTLKAMYGSAFRAPTVLELGTINSPRSVGNRALKPEKIHTLELAWLQGFQGAQFTLTGYRSKVTDQIVAGLSAGPNPLPTRVNSGTDHLSGVEFEVFGAIGANISARAAFAHGFELAADPQSFPRNIASLIVNHHHGRLNTNLSIRYRSGLQANNLIRETLRSAWHADLNLRYAMTPKATFIGSITNLADDDTGEFTTTSIPGGSPQRGRAFRIGVQFSL